MGEAGAVAASRLTVLIQDRRTGLVGSVAGFGIAVANGDDSTFEYEVSLEAEQPQVEGFLMAAVRLGSDQGEQKDPQAASHGCAELAQYHRASSIASLAVPLAADCQEEVV